MFGLIKYYLRIAFDKFSILGLYSFSLGGEHTSSYERSTVSSHGRK